MLHPALARALVTAHIEDQLRAAARWHTIRLARRERATRDAFERTRDLADELGLLERSMGMSDDLEIACELGSTEVRVGRALFGPRPG